MRDLWVQEFLRELVVGVTAPSGVAAPSVLAGSFTVKILHSVESRDIELVCSNLDTILLYLRLLISLSLVFYILHVLIVLIFICLIYRVLN